jgi:DnaJ like chaperone protein
MNWRNAVIGALVGWAILRHPVGLLIGALVGYALGPRWGDERPKVVPARMLQPLFALAGALARADGRVSEAEVAAAEHWMQRLDLNRRMRREAVAAFESGKQAGFDLDVHARELSAYCLVRLDLKLMLLGALHQITAADGAVHAEAARLHRRIVELMEVPEDLWQQAQARFDRGEDAGPVAGDGAIATVSDYHALGVSRDASDADIRRAYRKLLARHHPDKLSGAKVSEHDRRLASERTRQLIAAYERIKRARGIR